MEFTGLQVKGYMQDYTDEQVKKMNKAFKLVQNKKHWKLPINKKLRLSDDELNIVSDAIIFHAGCVPSITKLSDGRYHIRAIGYYAAIGS